MNHFNIKLTPSHITTTYKGENINVRPWSYRHMVHILVAQMTKSSHRVTKYILYSESGIQIHSFKENKCQNYKSSNSYAGNFILCVVATVNEMEHFQALLFTFKKKATWQSGCLTKACPQTRNHSQVCHCTPLITAGRRHKQTDVCEFHTSLV